MYPCYGNFHRDSSFCKLCYAPTARKCKNTTKAIKFCERIKFIDKLAEYLVHDDILVRTVAKKRFDELENGNS